MQLTAQTTHALEDMATVLVGSIDRIQQTGYMSMSYGSCAIGTVQYAAGEINQPYHRGRSGPVLRLLDQIAREKGAQPHERHTGGWIEGYGEYEVHWDYEKMLPLYYDALDLVQAELALREAAAAAAQPEAVPA